MQTPTNTPSNRHLTQIEFAQPALGFVGPLLGTNPGWVTSQGEILARLFQKVDYRVSLTSRHPGRLHRLLNTVSSILSWHGQVEIIILMVFSGPGFIMADISSRLARLTGRPMILWLHGGNLPEFSVKHPRWTRSVLRRGDAIVSPSSFLAHHFHDYGFDVKVIPNVLDLSQYPYRHRTTARPRLLWMRTFNELYNPQMAVEVLHNIRQTHPDATLTMAGQDKGLLADIKSVVKTMRLNDHVRFPGFLDAQAKQQEFSRHNIFLNTNRVDNMPVSVVEAAAFGLPIVATKVGGIPYLLTHEETALLVPSEDSNAMAMAIRRLLDNPDLATRLSENARCLAERSSWAAVRPQWEALFKELTRDA